MAWHLVKRGGCFTFNLLSV